MVTETNVRKMLSATAQDEHSQHLHLMECCQSQVEAFLLSQSVSTVHGTLLVMNKFNTLALALSQPYSGHQLVTVIKAGGTTFSG